jgi:hypothetical protein
MTTFIPRRINAKASKAGKTYWEVETDQGNATCFDYPIVQEIEKSLGKPISLYDLETNEKGFINLRPAKNKPMQTPSTNQNFGSSAQEIKPSQQANPNQFAEARMSKDVSIYTSYAKDIFLQLQQQEYEVRTSDKAMGGNSPEFNMNLAIKLIKQAKVSFERSEIFKGT